MKTFQGSIKILTSFAVVMFLRLIPWRMPNLEGVMTTLMPVSKGFGGLTAFFYAALSMALFDVITGYVGPWTILTALTYGIVGLASAAYFRNRALNRKNAVGFAVVATFFYDAITGVLGGPLMFGQSFVSAFIGQIPFTAYHLLGNIVLAFVLSPVLAQFVLDNPKLEVGVLWGKIRGAFN